jgi:hypothetical protein
MRAIDMTARSVPGRHPFGGKNFRQRVTAQRGATIDNWQTADDLRPALLTSYVRIPIALTWLKPEAAKKSYACVRLAATKNVDRQIAASAITRSNSLFQR